MIFFIVIVVIVVVAIETWRMHHREKFSSNTHTKEPQMNSHEPVQPFTDRTVRRSDRPRGLGSDGSPDEQSLNDVAKLREQDQTIAQLSEQINRMVGSPWEVVDVEGCDLYTAEIRFSGADVRKVAWQLAQMCNPVAVAGNQSANVGVGSTQWVEVGHRRIFTGNRDHSAQVMAAINGKYAEAMAPFRRRALEQLHQYANGRDPSAIIPLAAAPFAVKCGQTYVACESREEAQNLCKALTEAYQTVIKDASALVMTELLRATAPKMGRDMRLAE